MFKSFYRGDNIVICINGLVNYIIFNNIKFEIVDDYLVIRYDYKESINKLIEVI